MIDWNDLARACRELAVITESVDETDPLWIHQLRGSVTRLLAILNSGSPPVPGPVMAPPWTTDQQKTVRAIIDHVAAEAAKTMGADAAVVIGFFSGNQGVAQIQDGGRSPMPRRDLYKLLGHFDLEPPVKSKMI